MSDSVNQKTSKDPVVRDNVAGVPAGYRSPAQWFSLVVGVTLLLAGVLGFFWDASFKTGDNHTHEELFGLFEVNGWHNLVHLFSGLLGLLAFRTYRGGRLFAMGLGVTYLLLVAVSIAWVGFGDEEIRSGSDVVFGLIPINTEDNLLHLLVGAVGLGIGAETLKRPVGVVDGDVQDTSDEV